MNLRLVNLRLAALKLIGLPPPIPPILVINITLESSHTFYSINNDIPQNGQDIFHHLYESFFKENNALTNYTCTYRSAVLWCLEVSLFERQVLVLASL